MTADETRWSVIKPLNTFETAPVEWCWPNRVPYGKLTGLEGDPDQGKTTFALWLAACQTVGGSTPDGHHLAPGSVIVLTAEDGLGDTVRPRLEAMGADIDRVVTLSIYHATEDVHHPPVIPTDVDKLRDAIEDQEARLLILDPLVAHVADSINPYKDHDMRRALAPLAAVAEDTGVAVLFIRHHNKQVGGKAIYRGGGTIAITAAARSVMLVATDPDNPDARVLASVKNNLGPRPPSLRFSLESAANGACRLDWDGESPHSANVLCAEPADPEERSAVNDLTTFLTEYVGECRRTWSEVRTACRKAGFDASDRTLRRARERAGIRYHRHGFGKGSTVVWELPDSIPAIPDNTGSHGRYETDGMVTDHTTKTYHSGQHHTGHDRNGGAVRYGNPTYEAQERVAIQTEGTSG